MRGWLWLGLVAQIIFVVSCTNTRSQVRTGNNSGKKVVVKEAVDPSDTSPFSHAVLLNGGQSPKANFYSHVVHLREMRKVLLARSMRDQRITLFASDGDNTGADLMVVKSITPAMKLLFRYTPERAFFEPVPRLINTVIQGKRLLPSKRWELEKFFSSLAERLPRAKPDTRPTNANEKPMLLFVTDHGVRNRRWRNDRNQKISLWRESMSVEQFSMLLRPLRQRKVVYVMSQCFSGSFLWSVFPQPGTFEVPDGNRCGFFSTNANRYAYGCYAQTQRGEDVGHAHRFIGAMHGAKSLVDAHHRVLLSDKTPDVPMRSSDGYLRALLTREAKQRNVSLADFASQLIANYGPRGGQLIDKEQRLIDAMAKRFAVARPRDVKEIPGRLRQFRKRKTFRSSLNNVWRSAYKSLRNDFLRQYYKLHPGMKKRVRDKWKSLMRDVDLQKRYHKDPDIARLAKGFPAFLAKQSGAFKRLALLEKKLITSKKLHFWTEVQMAVLMRMEVLLYRMAGRLLLAYDKRGAMQRYRRGLRRLMACENVPLGKLPNDAKQPTLKPIVVDHTDATPSLLGVQFRRFKHKINARVSPGTVQVKAVGLKTPAERAGVRRGDLLVGANGTPFRAHYDLREQIMMHPKGKPFVLHALRQGKIHKLPVKLALMKTPNFMKYRDIKGTTLPSLSTLKLLTPQATLPTGKDEVVLMFFWATWCGPCKRALPILRKWHLKYPKLKIIASSPEKRLVVEKWYAKHPKAMPFLRVHDQFGQFSVKMLVFSFPTFVLARRGKVVLVHKGAHKFAMVEKQIERALQP